MKKICYDLYRVSSKKQLYLSEGNKDDIPMQRQACREFAEQMGWQMGKELSKAVSEVVRLLMDIGWKSRGASIRGRMRSTKS